MIKQLLGRIGRPEHVTEESAALFQALAPTAPLPWRAGDLLERKSGMIYDANGRHIATVDEWAELDDDEAEGIAMMIIAAVNAYSVKR